MKYFILPIFLVLFFDCQGQSGSPTPVMLNASETMLPEQLPGQTASSQAERWKMAKNATPSNAIAWFNYYLWTERDRDPDFTQKKLRLTAIATEAADHIAQSPYYFLISFLESGKTDSVSLFHSLALAEDKSWVYPYVIQFSIIRHNKELLAEYCIALNTVSPLPKSLYEYHYNVLMSADSNATIYGRGLNDIVPMAILQQVYAVRKDIRLSYYAGPVKQSANTYLCLSLGKEILSGYPDAAYTGLLVKADVRNTANELKKHVGQDFNLQYFETTPYLEPAIALLYRNYLPAFILLYKDYRQRDAPQASKLKERILKIAVTAGVSAEVTKLLEN